MPKSKRVILFGTGDLAVIAYEYFMLDSEYEVVAFTVDKEYLEDTQLCGLPVVPFEDVHIHFPPDEHEMYVCIVYGNLNRLRAATCGHAKTKGYRLASYISSRAFVSPSANIGEHCFIFENNVIQSFVSIGDNCILWSGNHVGHSTKIGNNVFISSHVCIGGWCAINNNCFVGVNSTLANNTSIGAESWVSHGTVLSGIIPPNSFVKPVQSEIVPLNEAMLFRALERARQ